MTSQQISSQRQRPQESVNENEMAFLVTHWLRNFTANNDNNNNNNNYNSAAAAASVGITSNETIISSSGGATATDEQIKAKRKALEQIQRAATDLASAFSTLGAFGTTSSKPSLTLQASSENGSVINAHSRNATFADLNRQWAALPSNHLGSLVMAAVSSTVAVEEVVDQWAESNLVHAADEAVHEERRNPSSGRTVQDAINLETMEHAKAPIVPVKPSLLQRAAQLNFAFPSGDSSEVSKPRSAGDPVNMPPLESQITQLQSNSSQAMREFLDLKEQSNLQAQELSSLKASLTKQQAVLQKLQHDRIPVAASLLPNPEGMEITADEHDAERVIAQLERKIGDLESSYAKVTAELATAQEKAYSQYDMTKKALLCYRDPFLDASRLRSDFGRRVARNNGLFRSIEYRRSGLPIYPLRTPHALEGTGSSKQLALRSRKALTLSRLSHALTASVHLNWPAYCLAFDKTGRYFITGADDMLARVFCLGAKQIIDSTGKGRLGPGQETTIRGAVLVCTLRGHASVINDMDVSSDNCFLATASDDGDCRIWGLNDGAPVAILRGHGNGCTSVMFSKLSPYRLTTTAEDGFARTWDIREAALKRYRRVVGKRPEYTLKLTAEEKRCTSKQKSENELDVTNVSNVVPPPLPERQNQPPHNVEAPVPPLPENAPLVVQAAAALPDQVPLPPLPPAPQGDGPAFPAAAGALENQQAPVNNGAVGPQAAEDGQFIPSSTIDEGVNLVQQFLHGMAVEERLSQPGTRSRRAAVKVLAIARCPLGGHFATGADDGVCRVWEDSEDPKVEVVDRRSGRLFDGTATANEAPIRRNTRRASSSPLLLQLKGHMNAITDLKYSNAGDRIMTGSQKDGVVRLWSWNADPIIPDSMLANNDRGLRHIVIKLTDPMAAKSDDTRKTRRRGGAAGAHTAATIELDTAVWSNDDSRIITSQSQPLKNSIVPGSNYLFIWDSLTGHCLLGIAQPHDMSCQVLLPHPTDSSILCSASKEVKVWDIETGECIFCHENEVPLSQQAAVGIKERVGQYLDGSFFPDGNGIALTDYNGRVSVFDTILPNSLQSGSSLASPPYWLKEQYFSSDYYDLFYDANGYCVEQGSGMPPHLAPRGVRCNMERNPYPETVTDAFKKLGGPLPSTIRDCRWHRELLRSRARRLQEVSGRVPPATKSRRGNIMQEFDPLTTILIRKCGEVIPTKNARGEILPLSPIRGTHPNRVSTQASVPLLGEPEPPGSEQRRTSASGRQLSSNYRWRDYSDMIQNERDAEEDEDDEDFELPVSNNRASAFGDSENEDDLDEFDPESPRRPRQQSRPAPRARQNSVRPRRQPEEEILPLRSSSRRRSSQRYDTDSEDDMDFGAEIVSTNNDPSGPHVKDYEKHYWKVPRNGPKIKKHWLERVESDSAYMGRKTYVPQVGDLVVYIPRVHLDTINTFPSVGAPWMDWPNESEWPVVKCRVRDMRFRFPYMNHFGPRVTGNKCDSIVAILTLEVIGIPVLSQDRLYNWPDPNFVDQARSYIFELDVFASSDMEEFIIPFDRYDFNLRCLEEAIWENNMLSEGIEVSAYYDDEKNVNDDPDLLLYKGKLDDYRMREQSLNDPNLNNSGYGSVNVSWDDSGGHSENRMSPWEIIIDKPKSKTFEFSRSCLSEEEKIRAREALKKIKRIPDVAEHFSDPVNERVYSDYSCRVEVPMNLQTIVRRLDANYYSTRWSMVFDVRQIRDNCIKYNGDIGALQDSAREMYGTFEMEMLSEEERRLFHDLKISGTSTGAGTTTTRSSLENLPAPPRHLGAGEAGRRSLRIRINASQATAEAPRRTSGRATRANPEADTDTSFANARRRQPRRRSNERRASDTFAEREAATAAAAEARQARERRASRRQSSDSQSALELVGQSSIAGRDHGRISAIRTHEPETKEEASAASERKDDSDTKPAARPRRNLRHGARTELGCDGENESAADNRRSTRSRRAHLQDEEDVTSARRKRKSYKDASDGRSSDQSEEESEEEDKKPLAITRRSASRKPAATASRRKFQTSSSYKGNRRTSNAVSYADLSESEFDEPESEEEVPSPKPTRRVRSDPRSRKRPRAESYEEEDEEDDESSAGYVATPSKRRKKQIGSGSRTKPWFEIKKSAITKVAQEMLSYLRDLDDDRIFAVPVLESYPDVEDDYLKVVSQPMDFRTIEDDRLPYYNSIRELQRDLTLVFQNCTSFNGRNSTLGKRALSLMDLMNDAYESFAADFKK